MKGMHIAAIAALLGLAQPVAQAQAVRLAAESLEPSAAALALPSQSLVDAALFFSGTRPERADASIKALEPALAEARGLAAESERQAAIRGEAPDRYALGEAILELAHRRFFRRYEELTTSLDQALLDGRYNCVSSSVVYLILAQAAGLEVFGITTKDHSFVALRLADGRLVDVETTNKHGFDPGSKKEFLDSFGRITGYAYVPPSDYARREAVSDRHLVGLIALNRATLAERRGEQAVALRLAIDAHAYMDDALSLSYLADRAHNAAAQLLNGRRFAEARDFIARFIGRYGSAGDLPSLLSQARLAVLADEVNASAALDPKAALAEVASARAEGLLSAGEYDEFVVAIHERAADAARRSGGWLTGWRYAAGALAAHPGLAGLVRLENSYKSNWVADTHNRFAAAFNARRYDEASRILNEGLTIAPGERLLMDDLKALEAARRP
jgi:hypothetical protein